MPLVSTAQDDWGGGIYRGRRAPGNATYDAVNGLVNDEGLIYRRGGSEYKSNADTGATLLGLADLFVSAGRRTIFTASDYPTTGAWVLDTDDATPLPLTTGAWWPMSRFATARGVAFAPGEGGLVMMYAGSRKANNYGTGTVDVTADSDQVTGSGTSWLANADPGMVFFSGGTTLGIVKSVESDTALTLTFPWPSTTATGQSYNLASIGGVSAAPILAYNDAVDTGEGVYLTTVGTPPRLVVALKQRAYLSPRDQPATLDDPDYLELPSDAEIVGADSILNTAFLFTTRGIWGLGSLDLDPIDAFGNQQWSQQQLNKDTILWGDSGLAAWGGGFVVPAMDDVFLFSPDTGATPITGSRFPGDAGIRTQYRGYVNSGLKPGLATVHAGHYFMPVVDPEDNTLVDTLVCRLDRGFTWTRWAGHAAGVAYARRVGSDTPSPLLLGINGERVTDLTGCFDPTEANALDADGTTSDFELVTRDYPTGGNQPGFAQKLRARYEMEGVEQSTADPFTRANETPLASPYAAWSLSDRPNLVSNAADVSGLLTGGDTTRTETVGPACFAQADFTAAVANNNVDIYYVGARLTAHSAAANGYSFWLDPGTGTAFVPKIRSGSSFTTIATGAAITSNVDGIRIECRGSTIIGLAHISGTWTEVVRATSSAYTAAGYVGFGINTFFGTPTTITAFTWGELAAITPAFSSDADDDVYTDLTSRGEQNGGAGWVDSDGSLYQWADVGKRRERIRFKLTITGATARFVLRSLELLTRPSGKQ